jgi:hypothetical protein
MRNYFDIDRIDLKILTDVKMSGPPEDQRVAFGVPFSVCLFVALASS